MSSHLNYNIITPKRNEAYVFALAFLMFYGSQLTFVRYIFTLTIKVGLCTPVRCLKQKLSFVKTIIDGSWGAWAATSDCTVTCGGGTQPRERICDSPAPSGVGIDCIGNSSDIANCSQNNCPIGKGIYVVV